MKNCYWIVCILFLTACTKKGGNDDNNYNPTASINAELISTNPVMFQFSATAYSQDDDPLVYTWNFRASTTKHAAQESLSYEPYKEYTVKMAADESLHLL
jgi:Tfp pilus assembly protein PilP